MKPVCPNCRTVLASEERTGPFPFCSWRCKSLDLYRWMNEEYRISEPATAEDLPDSEADADAPKREAPN